MCGEEGISLVPNPVYGIDLDRDGDAALFPPKGPIRAHESGLPDFSRNHIYKQRHQRVITH